MNLMKPLVFSAAMLAAAGAWSQELDAPEQGAPTEQSAQPEQNAEPEMEVKVYQDWEVRCETEADQCFMYQMVRNASDSPVAEIRIVDIEPRGEAVAGATVVTPLGTLLDAGVVLQIDEREARKYPFNWCTRAGCFARFGLTDAEIAAMKAGNVVKMRLLSVSAPDQPILLDVSLAGFTAAYNEMSTPEG